MARNALTQFRKMVTLAPYLPDEIFIAAMNIGEPNNLADFIAANINLDTAGEAGAAGGAGRQGAPARS